MTLTSIRLLKSTMHSPKTRADKTKQATRAAATERQYDEESAERATNVTSCEQNATERHLARIVLVGRLPRLDHTYPKPANAS